MIPIQPIQYKQNPKGEFIRILLHKPMKNRTEFVGYFDENQLLNNYKFITFYYFTASNKFDDKKNPIIIINKISIATKTIFAIERIDEDETKIYSCIPLEIQLNKPF